MKRIGRVASVALILSIPLAACNQPEDEQNLEQTQDIFAAGDSAALRAAEELALRYIETKPQFLQDVGSVWTKGAFIDERKEAHVRLFQTVNGIPVWEGEGIMHLDQNGVYSSITDHFFHNIKVDTKPRFSDMDAITFAVEEKGGWSHVKTEPVADLQILMHEGQPHLTYRVQFDHVDAQDNLSKPVIFMDAHTGDTLFSYNNLQTARNRNTYTANNGTTLPGTLVRNETSTASNDAVLNQAHDGAGLTYDYYFNIHGRDSYDGRGATITSTVHYQRNYVNAFWNNTQMVYGDGDGVNASALTVLDVVAHELTHAVTSNASNLTYANESGALNEAMSDIFGAAVEAYRDGAVTRDTTWKVGEECWTPSTPGDALRYMYSPTLASSDKDFYPERYTGTQDNGGVHWNSGIANLAFYLMVEGGTHPRGRTTTMVPALDTNKLRSIEKAARVFYRANTVYMTAGTNFTRARVATARAATDLFGANSPEVRAVDQAWIAVGVPDPPNYRPLDERTGINGTTGQQLSYQFVTPPNATHIQFELIGDNGDADLYVRFGSAPTGTTYDCASAGPTSNELCEITPARQGTYYVLVDVYDAFTNLTLRVSWAGALPAEVCDDGLDNDQDGRIDCDDSDCTANPVCQFVGTMHVADLDGTGARASAKAWQSTVTVQVTDNNNAPVSGATVSGAWSTGSITSGMCVTGANGQCTLTSGQIRVTTSSVAFNVTQMTHPSLGYSRSANTDPDGDSNGTTITVARP